MVKFSLSIVNRRLNIQEFLMKYSLWETKTIHLHTLQGQQSVLDGRFPTQFICFEGLNVRIFVHCWI